MARAFLKPTYSSEVGLKTLVLGLGNPILSDDSVGFRVVQELRDRINRPGLTFMESSDAGLGLLDLINGYDKAFIIDDNTVVLGSYNFSKNADESNDENFLIIHNPEIAAQFMAEFNRNLAQAQNQPD